MKPSLHVVSETAEISQGGFSVRLETDCTFFPVVAKDFEWKPDAFSKAILGSADKDISVNSAEQWLTE